MYNKEKKFSYIKKGTGHPLILLHGLMGGLSNFNALLNFFPEKGYQVIIPVLPLYKMPLFLTNIYSLSKYIIHFLIEIGIENSTLIGNSLGGHIALIIAKKRIDLVHSLVLTGSSGLFEKAFGDAFPKRENYEYIKKKSQEVFYDPKIATKELVDEVFHIVNDKKKGIKTLYIAKSSMKYNMSKDLSVIEKPICLIWGKQDPVTPPEVAKEFHRLLPHSELYWIDKCGHVPMMEHPKKFIKILEKWLSKFNLNHENFFCKV
ncbi:alpha/beta fold hydrolase [Blattabacterium sp. (Cryptocercus punctulatus) str. Cpu]|uniref:alpha/beta fold hydrolase n=1 Tax=Blattabacterium sp. (Cryptocercus punctulatus) str. Cpu TaxID=1075399 RepID=UPI000238723A|nr:alpha/beta hydrolase [Blattabacterium sp. (Cryptocercus punctulatus) str. Cpu]AEU09141.1 alpha/beta fold family hydrolase [Blattabacterium sp. (Cryptocercus punctulatus) str. Cpu]